MPRPAAPARRCRRTITRPGRSSPASTAPSATSSTTASTTARSESVVQLREAPAKEKTLRRGDFICLPARRLPSHRDAGRLGQRAASSFLWPEPRAPARPRVGRHGDGSGQALHGQGQDPDAAALGAAGQGDAEVGRGVRLLRRARGGRVLDPGPSAVRHAAAAVAPRAARARPAARSAHPHRADGQRRGRPRSAMGRPRQPRRRQALAAGLHQPRRHEGRAEGLARRGLRGLHRRQRAQQGVRRGGRARERHAAHRRRRPAEAASTPRPTW